MEFLANVAFSADMKEHFVIDPLISKRQQLLLATQLCRMVLKVRIVTFGVLLHAPGLSLARHTFFFPFPVKLSLLSVVCVISPSPVSLALQP